MADKQFDPMIDDGKELTLVIVVPPQARPDIERCLAVVKKHYDAKHPDKPMDSHAFLGPALHAYLLRCVEEIEGKTLNE